MQAQFAGRSLKQRSAANNEAKITGRRSLTVYNAVKKSSLRSIVCSKTLKIKDGRKEDAKKMCKDIADWAKEQMKDSDKGIEIFEVFQDAYEKNQIHFWERYKDNTRMGRINTCDRFQKFMVNIQDCLEEPVGMVLFDWKDGQLGPVAVQGGPKSEGGLDDATGSSKRAIPIASETVNVENGSGDDSDGEQSWFPELKFNLPEIRFPWDD